MSRRLLLALALALAAAACTPPASVPADAPDAGPDAGPAAPDAGPDAGPGEHPDAGPSADWDIPSVTYTVNAGAPITAPDETWTFVSVPEAHCANGSSTGFGVNVSHRSKRVVIFLAGGGACWEAGACAAGTAVHIQDTMGAGPVLAEAQNAGLGILFDRADATNPFRDASFVYVPYCTGDLHAGTRTNVYDWFGPRPLEHVGAKNIDADLRRLQPTFPEADRVTLVGASAGGVGTLFHGWRVQKAFPHARVDLFDDSGPGIDLAGDGRWGTLRAAWAPDFPPGCSDCEAGLSGVSRRSAELLSGDRRLALASYRQDQTIATYFGLSGADVSGRLDALRAGAPANLRTFFLAGTGHVVLASPDVAAGDGVTGRAWLRTFADDASAWTNAGP